MIVVVVGYGRSGKDTFASFLEEMGYKKYVFSDVLRKIAEERGLEPTKETLVKIGWEIRKTHGARKIAELLVENVKETDNIVFVGPRSPEEVEYLEEKYGNIVVVHVWAPEDMRRERGALEWRDEEDKKKGMDDVIARADIVVANDGSLEELRARAQAFVEEGEYIEAGMRAGLEIHQQLDTEKLFCRCPSVLREDEPDVVVERYQRPVASEMGEFDPAALAEFMKGRKYVYQAYSDTTCLVELDEEPPGPVNGDALRVALQITAYVRATPVDVIHVMRKTVIDGSNTTGFQRTMLVATDGKIRGLFSDVRVPTICLEEDAARVIEQKGDVVVYRVDRLGIPLIEISTGPDLRSPRDVKHVAERMGLLLRATGKVKRGLGTIRQDVNVSIRNGARVEIKGIQELAMIDEYVRNEVCRQKALLEIRDELRKRGAEVGEVRDVTDAFANTQCKFIASALKRKHVVLAVKLARMKGLLGKEVQKGRRFGTEISDYVKVHAGLNGILHSDELPAYGITQEEVQKVRAVLGCKDDDAFALVVGEKDRAKKAMDVIRKRVEQAFDGVPEETRGPNPDGTTRYARPLPGAARMYPETDVEPVRVDFFDEVVRTLPPLPEERADKYVKMGVSEDLVRQLVRSPHVFLFDEMVEKGADPSFAATLLVNKLRYWRREGYDVSALTEETLIKIAVNYEKKYPKEALDEIVKHVCEGKTFEEALKEAGAEMVDEDEVRKIVADIVERLKKEGKDKFNIVMGEAMKVLRGRASGKIVSKVVKELMEG